MSGKKGMQHYSKEFKNMVVGEYKKGASQKGLSKKYGVSRYAIQSWCGLCIGRVGLGCRGKASEHNARQQAQRQQ